MITIDTFGNLWKDFAIYPTSSRYWLEGEHTRPHSNKSIEYYTQLEKGAKMKKIKRMTIEEANIAYQAVEKQALDDKDEFVPVVHAKWNPSIIGNKCSHCEEVALFNYPYCPYCGAKMDGKMTAKEAKGIIYDMICLKSLTQQEKEALNIAYQAIEKQIPKEYDEDEEK